MSIEDLEGRHVLVSMTETIQAPANEIWPFLSAIGAERILIPGCTRSSLLEGFGEGALRRIYFGDTAFDERILELNPKTYKMKYEVCEPNSSPAEGTLAAVQLHPSGPNETTITWVVGAKVVPAEHAESLQAQSAVFEKGQIAALRKLTQITPST
ncbi:hypothetical protein BGZ61DRAFT_231373 [Ilyonectria robusta]|uniref:uncharacterized protein n=1 Tax=Ilyonectria robusta TaxID=1079257 RepID=UPI001E8EA9AA|nr:uncharacterized protein BGZ61DRAFT_231373 [Ilyonectria robusta]KAH8651472.1 hypothetical protein BGZ61DRAFT_231373 [Ilyonectria robusta]